MQPKLFLATKALIISDGKVLVIRESSKYEDGAQVGKYDLPGGRLTPGEHFLDALKREITEETGLEVEIGNPVFVNESRPVVKGEQWQIVRIFFEAKALTMDVVLSADHDAYEWIDPKEYLSHHVIENLYPVFEEFLKRKEQWYGESGI